MRLASLLLAALVLAAAPARASAPVDPTVEEASRRLVALLADPTPEAALALRRRVEVGAPPGALMAMLDAFRSTPRIEVLDVVQELAGYRRADVRGRALAAWAATEGVQAERAIAAAAADTDPVIRKLAVALASLHPSAAAAKIVADLLARDTELAAELADTELQLVPGDPT